MAVTVAQVAERFSQLLTLKRGDGNVVLSGLNTPRLAERQQLIFVADRKLLGEARESKAQVWVVHPSLTAEVPTDRIVLETKQVQLAMALIGRAFFPVTLAKQPYGGQRLHPSAFIDPSAQLADDVIVGPNATIGPRVRIGSGAVIGPNTTIEAEASIGDRTHIHAQVYIAYQTQIGADCEIHPQTSIGTEGFGYAHDAEGRHHRQTHYGRVIIEDGVHIGAGVQVDRGTFDNSVIGAGTIIDNHCHFGHNIKIGKGTIITGGMIAAGSVTIGERCLFGGRTSIAGHLQIASGSQFAGLSGVNISVPEPGQYGGYPLQPLRAALKTSTSLAKLPQLRKNVARIMRHLGLEADEE